MKMPDDCQGKDGSARSEPIFDGAISRMENHLTLEARRTAENTRFVFIDSLRGIAALLVVLHHILFGTEMAPALRAVLPTPITFVSDFGAYGVQIFFVISGFVIAYSLRNCRFNREDVLNFIARRQVRLDPPYWAALLFVSIIAIVKHAMLPATNPPWPGLRIALLDGIYLQSIMRLPRLLEVAWTLCLEVQFYLVFILVLAAGGRRERPDQLGVPGRLPLSLLLSSGMVSIFLNARYSTPAWFIEYWFYFVGGALCCWAISGRIREWVFLTFAGLQGLGVLLAYKGVLHGLGLSAASNDMTGRLFALTTVLLIYGAGKRGTLASWGAAKWLQYLGRISYSLYLIHLPLITFVMRIGLRATGTAHFASLIWYALTVAVCIGAAHLLHVAVERPAMKLAARFKPSAPEITVLRAAAPLAPAMQATEATDPAN